MRPFANIYGNSFRTMWMGTMNCGAGSYTQPQPGRDFDSSAINATSSARIYFRHRKNGTITSTWKKNIPVSLFWWHCRYRGLRCQYYSGGDMIYKRKSIYALNSIRFDHHVNECNNHSMRVDLFVCIIFFLRLSLHYSKSIMEKLNNGKVTYSPEGI